MKISELLQILKARPDIQIPLSVAGENRHITLQQILDAVPAAIVPFKSIGSAPANTVIADTTAPPLGSVVYDTTTQRFYFAVLTGNVAEGTLLTTYYKSWAGSEDFYDSNNKIRQDCIFRDADGQLYFHDGTTLKTAGGPKTQVISLADYESLTTPDPDTIYYIYEDDE